ncbi:MAG TPA: hypothetical protein VHV83_17660 [Armatimonadota bacterium]|nr:hypothetical protein [Armatimonadota bacterium]
MIGLVSLTMALGLDKIELYDKQTGTFIKNIPISQWKGDVILSPGDKFDLFSNGASVVFYGFDQHDWPPLIYNSDGTYMATVPMRAGWCFVDRKHDINQDDDLYVIPSPDSPETGVFYRFIYHLKTHAFVRCDKITFSSITVKDNGISTTFNRCLWGVKRGNDYQLFVVSDSSQKVLRLHGVITGNQFVTSSSDFVSNDGNGNIIYRQSLSLPQTWLDPVTKNYLAQSSLVPPNKYAVYLSEDSMLTAEIASNMAQNITLVAPDTNHTYISSGYVKNESSSYYLHPALVIRKSDGTTKYYKLATGFVTMAPYGRTDYYCYAHSFLTIIDNYIGVSVRLQDTVGPNVPKEW